MNGFIQELFQANLYKRTQGRITRQVTLAALVIAVAVGAWRLHNTLITPPKFVGAVSDGTWLAINMGVSFGLFLALSWVSFRLVHLPRFADFLIAVEAEMQKVSWPSRTELVRSSIVVLVTIFVLAAVLFVFDGFWAWFFKAIGVM